MANARGVKRRADDGFDPIAGEINMDMTPSYDSKGEQAPHSVVQSKEWRTYQEATEQFRQLLLEPTAKHAHDDQFTRGLIDLIHDRVAGSKSETITVCLTGPMGTGKSATLNSLFSVGPIAREGDYGGSCTLASCLYRGPKKDQEAPFMAEVRFFDRQERREILTQYLAAYYHANHLNEEEEDDTPGSQLNSDDFDASLDIRNEVVQALVSLFGNRAEFQTKQAARNFLEALQSQRDTLMLDRLFSWCDSLINRTTGGASVATVTASTAGELNTKLENFTTHVEDDNGNLVASLTPMVSLITFYFDDMLTRLGIEFLDTPGTSDCNRARKMSAQKHSHSRTHCVILSDESRVKDDAGISKEIKRMRNKGKGRTVVVVTRSDIIKDTTMPPGSKKDKEKVQEYRKAAEKLKKELNAMDIEESNVLASANDQRLRDFMAGRKERECRLVAVENAEKAQRIGMRSESNKKCLEEKLLDIMPTVVPVLSISNTEYARHLEGYGPKQKPVLDVEQTNIPKLRRIISAFPNEARLNEIKHRQETNLPSLLTKVQLYTAKSPSDRKEDMEYYTTKPSLRFGDVLAVSFENFRRELRDMILDPMRAQELDWSQAAEDLCGEWRRKFTTAAFLMLMKRQGLRKKSGRNCEMNLSADLIHLNSRAMSSLFGGVIGLIQRYKDDVFEDMKSLVDDMLTELREDANEPFMTLGPFYDTVNAETKQIEQHIHASFERLFDALCEIQRKVSTEDEDVYIVEAMLPIYEHVSGLKQGRMENGVKVPRPKDGWPKYRHIVFKHEVTKFKGIWAGVCASVEQEVDTILKLEAGMQSAALEKVFEGFHADFNRLCEAKDCSDPREKMLQEELKVNVEKAGELLRGPMQQLYDAMERQFRRGGAEGP